MQPPMPAGLTSGPVETLCRVSSPGRSAEDHAVSGLRDSVTAAVARMRKAAERRKLIRDVNRRVREAGAREARYPSRAGMPAGEAAALDAEWDDIDRVSSLHGFDPGLSPDEQDSVPVAFCAGDGETRHVTIREVTFPGVDQADAAGPLARLLTALERHGWRPGEHRAAGSVGALRAVTAVTAGRWQARGPDGSRCRRQHRRHRAATTTRDDGAGDPDPEPSPPQALAGLDALAALGWSATPELTVRRCQAAWLRVRPEVTP